MSALEYNPELGTFDLALHAFLPDRAATVGNDIGTVVVIALFSDRRAEPDDRLPDDSGDRRGWWADIYGDQPIGSRLWLLSREKMLPGLEQRIESYAREALQVLVDEGAMEAFDVSAERLSRDTVGLQVACVVTELDPPPGPTRDRLYLDGLDIALLVRQFRRLGDVHFPEFEYEG